MTQDPQFVLTNVYKFCTPQELLAPFVHRVYLDLLRLTKLYQQPTNDLA